MESKKNFLENENAVGFSLIMDFTGKNPRLELQARIEPGEPLKKKVIENATESQVSAVCDVLENMR